MIIDYKYHIASLVAVFLALGIGILIGSTMLDNDALIDYQKQVADSLDNQLDSLRQEKETMKAITDTLENNSTNHEKFEKQVLPVLTAGLLKGKKFALVELNGLPPELIEVIKGAEGNVSSITSISALNDDKEILAKLHKSLNWQQDPEEAFVDKLATDIASYMITGENNDGVIKFLTEEELIKTSGEYGIPVDGVIIVSGNYNGSKHNLQIDFTIMDYFTELNIPVVGVEETGVPHSLMKEYQRKNISTVDNIDTVPGLLALVLALNGQPGDYGVKPTAQGLLPDLKKLEGE